MNSFLRSTILRYKIKLCRRLGRPVSFTFRGHRYWLNSDEAAGYHIAHSTEKLQRMVDLIPPGSRTIFDVGANCGIFSALAKRRLPHSEICSIEASRELIPLIHKNCPDGVRIIECAVAEADGSIEFYINGASQQTNSILKSSVEVFAKEVRSVTVLARSLDSLAAELTNSSVDVLKIDIQGAEVHAFKGGRLTLTKVSTIFIESSWLEIDSVTSIVPFARRFGFEYLTVINPVHMGADLMLTRFRPTISQDQGRVSAISQCSDGWIEG